VPGTRYARLEFRTSYSLRDFSVASLAYTWLIHIPSKGLHILILVGSLASWYTSNLPNWPLEFVDFITLVTVALLIAFAPMFEFAMMPGVDLLCSTSIN